MKFLLVLIGLLPLADAFAYRCIALDSKNEGMQIIPLNGSLNVRDSFTITGTAKAKGEYFVFNFFEGSPKKVDPNNLISLHVKVYLENGNIIFSTLPKPGHWYPEEPKQTVIKNGVDFKLDIKLRENDYLIYVNDKLIWTYNYRKPSFETVKAIGISGIKFRNTVACSPDRGVPSKSDSKIVLIENGVVKINYATTILDSDLTPAGKKKIGPVALSTVVIEI
ncbi:unnamed protein product [Caenorhabditis auriculariae]|uniref:Galectin n=1 Tax=Caenorhabditis auriculariae TaxID=2777116 RepID=A0A8S1H2M7_9PELO|nr:unnamed protein product [Caenorhabditis auriculariae]